MEYHQALFQENGVKVMVLTRAILKIDRLRLIVAANEYQSLEHVQKWPQAFHLEKALQPDHYRHQERMLLPIPSPLHNCGFVEKSPNVKTQAHATRVIKYPAHNLREPHQKAQLAYQLEVLKHSPLFPFYHVLDATTFKR
jgi:hypothetical protein